MMKIQPQNDYILVEPVQQERQTKGGIFLPQTSEDKPVRGKVAAVGGGKMTDEGKRLPITVQVGAEVIFKRYAPDEIKIDDKTYYFIREEDILAVVEK